MPSAIQSESQEAILAQSFSPLHFPNSTLRWVEEDVVDSPSYPKERKVSEPSPQSTQSAKILRVVYARETLEQVARHAARQVVASADRRVDTLARSQENSAIRLRELAQLERDWDSYGGLPATGIAIATASLFLQKLAVMSVRHRSMFIHPWAIVPIADGGVQFHWRDGRRDIEIEFSSIGDIYYFIELDGRVVVESDDEVPASLEDALSDVFRSLE